MLDSGTPVANVLPPHLTDNRRAFPTTQHPSSEHNYSALTAAHTPRSKTPTLEMSAAHVSTQLWMSYQSTQDTCTLISREQGWSPVW